MYAGVRIVLALAVVSLMGAAAGMRPLRARAEQTTAALTAAVSAVQGDRAVGRVPGWGALLAGCYCLTLVRRSVRSG